MTSRAEALNAAGEAIAAGLDLRDSLPAREAAELCWTPTGPSVDDLEQMITAQRERAAGASVVALPVTGETAPGRAA